MASGNFWVSRRISPLGISKRPHSHDSLVVVSLASVGELSKDLSEGSGAGADVSKLVLAHGVLDVGKDESVVKLARLLVVGLGVGELLRQEVDWSVSLR
jgi:hypothetical protein